ncbi:MULTISPECIES: hypothetical protein [Amycolatopsis]|nr:MULTISPECIES: hypothetical protein [Amycolatopsis]
MTDMVVPFRLEYDRVDRSDARMRNRAHELGSDRLIHHGVYPRGG